MIKKRNTSIIFGKNDSPLPKILIYTEPKTYILRLTNFYSISYIRIFARKSYII